MFEEKKFDGETLMANNTFFSGVVIEEKTFSDCSNVSFRQVPNIVSHCAVLSGLVFIFKQQFSRETQIFD